MSATIEHASHTGHIVRVETAQVKAYQVAATIEQVVHVGHLGRVEIA
jgi:hypothetical protein